MEKVKSKTYIYFLKCRDRGLLKKKSITYEGDKFLVQIWKSRKY